MKLLSTFKKIVDEISPEICWFTTFNLNVELLEKYVLAAITGKEPSELKRAEDYEALNLELNKFNVKIWYDHRALDLRHGKRTTVDLYSVDASKILGSKSNEPIFHPKVIFLKGVYSAYILTGSFNLSIAGWSSNRECVVVKKIESQDNAFDIIEFFKNLNAKSSDLVGLNKWANELPDVKSSWKFSTNFNTPSIINELKGEELNIWSPYFSKNAVELLNEIKKSGFNKINLIPDINQSQEVKITPAELKKIVADKSIQILFDQNINKDKQPLFHAKVWLSENKIAIGSWNCSYRALGVKIAPNEKNIEAGIIEDINTKQRIGLLSNLKNIDVNLISGTEKVEMDLEWREVLKTYSMSCDIIANWESFTYETDFDDKTLDYSVALPHDPNKRYPLHKVTGLSFIDGYNRLLKNKLFTVYNSKNEVVFVGYLNETCKPKRPVNGYVSFYDLFESLNIDPCADTNKSRVKYQFDEEDNKGSEKEVLPYFTYSGHESYYLMFVSFQKLIDSIRLNCTNLQKLEDLGFRLPSSLINIKTLFFNSFKEVKEENKEDDLLFHYFLAMEINECIKLFNQFSEKQIDQIVDDQFIDLLKIDKKDLFFIKKAMAIK